MTYTVTPQQMHDAEQALDNALREGASLTSCVHVVLGAFDHTPTITLDTPPTLFDVAFTRYPRGKEITYWERMPTVPAVDHTVHLQVGPDPDDSIALTVTHVSWAPNDGHPDLPEKGWHAEIALRG